MSLETFNINTNSDAYTSLKPINWCLKIFSLCSIYRVNNILSINYSLYKAISLIAVLGIINVMLFILKLQALKVVRDKGPAKFTDFIQFIYLYGYFEYIVSIYSVYRNRQSCLNYFKNYNNIDRLLGATYGSLTRKIIIRDLCLFTTLCVCTSIFDYISWTSADAFLSTLYCPDYVYAAINLLSLIDFISHLTLVQFRLKLIKGILFHYYSNTYVSLDAGQTKDSDGWTAQPVATNINHILNNLKLLHYNDRIEISTFKKCYLMLLEQIVYLNNAYGIRILFYCWNTLYNMINLINLAIRVSTGAMRPEETPSHWYLPAITSVIALLNYSGVILMTLYRCEKCYAYRDGLIRIVDLTLQNKYISFDVKLEFEELRNLLTSRPVRFHAANFFKLDYTLLVSGSTMVITYTIIMLQSI